MARKPGRLLTVLLVGVCLVVAGGAIVAAVIWDDPPSLLAEPSSDTNVAVTQRTFDDSQNVNISVRIGIEQPLTISASGVLTSFECDTGTTVESGHSLFSVDGVPTVLLSTSLPMWRDISSGDSGADVVALATELSRLGLFAGDVNAKAGAGLLAAFKTLATNAGIPASLISRTIIPISQIGWLPHQTATIASCEAAIGSPVATGQSIATFSSPIVSARITTSLADLVPGDRILTVGGVPIVANLDGTITEPDALAALASTDAVKAAIVLKSLDTISGQYTLSSPLTVSVIPPAAIRTDATGMGCVLGDGQAMQVQVVSSELGQSFVLFSDAPPQSVSLNIPPDLTCP